jgi:hypothetical protein
MAGDLLVRGGRVVDGTGKLAWPSPTDAGAGHVAMSPVPLIVVSSDNHIGPLVEQQLRDYCPSAHLDDFDAFVAAHRKAAAGRGLVGFGGHPNSLTAGHKDVDQRLRNMDRDGIAAEVIFHGSQNG